MQPPRAGAKRHTVPAGTVWLLQCLVHSMRRGHGARLRDIIAFGDYINHAVFEYREFSEALGYLMRARVVFIRRGHIYLSKRFRDLLPALVPQGERPAFAKEYAALEGFVGTLRSTAAAKETGISERVFAQAVSDYLDAPGSGRKSKK